MRLTERYYALPDNLHWDDRDPPGYDEENLTVSEAIDHIDWMLATKWSGHGD